MKTEVLMKNKMYKVFNDIALKNEIVVFGSDFTANFPFYELSKKYLSSNALYNRSIEGLTILEAGEILDDCVFGAKPSKIFFAIGEHDAKDSSTLDAYKDILKKTKNALPLSKIYILSLCGCDTFNALLRSLCTDFGTEFINIDYKKSAEAIFRQLLPFFRNSRINFCEAFNI